MKFLSRALAESFDAYLDYFGISRNLVLIAGWACPPEDAIEPIELRAGKRRIEIAALTIVRGTRPDVATRFGVSPNQRLGFVIAATLDSRTPRGAPLELRLGSGRRRARLPLATAASSRDRFAQAIRSYAPRERDAACRLAEAVLGRKAVNAIPDGPTELGCLRLKIESAAAAGRTGVFVRGWLLDPEQSLRGMRLRIGSWSSADLVAKLGRLPRLDVDRAFGAGMGTPATGLVCFVPTPERLNSSGAELVLTTRDSQSVAIPLELEELPSDPLRLSESLLAEFDPFRAGSVELLQNHLGPALEAAWQPETRRPVDRAWQAGTPPSVVVRSVVVPLFGRHDFMLYQVNEFARDADFEDTELIYVVDDPRLLDQTLSLARSLYELYGLPIQVTATGGNLGFAGATNLGARQARGRYLVLLNSDVLPARPGWLGRLQYRLRELPDAGPIAPRLLYHDTTIQHDGIAFRQDPIWPGIWLNDHPGKGLPTTLANGPLLERVPAVSAACLMIERDLYERLGGLDERYLIGDYEDSDLCLKAASRGRASYIVRDEILFHLERQSQSLVGGGSWRLRVTLYNAWRHGRIWANELAAHREAAS